MHPSRMLLPEKLYFFIHLHLLTVIQIERNWSCFPNPVRMLYSIHFLYICVYDVI